MEHVHDSSSSSTEDDLNILIDLIRNRRWDGAMVRTRTTNTQRRDVLRRKDEDGGLPLHWACACGAPFELVEAMLEGYPEAVRMTNNRGCLPLHEACFRLGGGVSPLVVRLLLEAYPEGSTAMDNHGELPLHKAADGNEAASSEVLTMLIDAHPKGVTTRDSCGLLPLHRVSHAARPDRKDDVEKVEVLLRPLLKNEEARHFAYGGFLWCKTPLHIGARFDLLGLSACLRMSRCPSEVIITVAKRHPEQLCERGEDGSLPLHLAAANPNLNGAEDIIVELVRLYPDAAATSDGEGRSALNLAIESGKRWKEGVEAIADAAKGVRTIRDVGTNLFPFMLAASAANPCITTVYELLRCCPDICKKP